MRLLSRIEEGSILAWVPRVPSEGRFLFTGCMSSAATAEIVVPEKPVKLRVFSLKDLDAATGGFAKSSFLGKGSHGCLYKGVMKDGKLVAVKRQEYVQDESAFDNELEILSAMHSPRFVNIVGYSRGFDLQEKLLVLDFMPNGTLNDILHHSAEPLDWPMRVQIALQVAKALLALHSASPPVIHRDVKSSSIWIDGKWNAKLGDFGLAFRGHIEDLKRHPVQPTATDEYTDPEYETPSPISTKVDVFSFGILLLEILTGRNAIDVRFKPPNIIDWALPLIKQGKSSAVYDRRLPMLPQHAKALRIMTAIACRCVRRSGSRQPSMSIVVAGLREVSRRIPLPKWIALASVMKRTASWQTRHLHVRDVRASPEVFELMGSPGTPPPGKPRIGKAATVPPAEQHSQEQRAHSHRKALFNNLNRLKVCMGQPKTSPRRTQSQETIEENKDNNNLDVSREQNFSSRLFSSSMRRLNVRLEEEEKVRHRTPSQESTQGNKHRSAQSSEALPRAIVEVSLGGSKSSSKRRYSHWRNPTFDVTKSDEKQQFQPMVLSIRPTLRGSFSDRVISMPMVELEEERRSVGGAAEDRRSSICLPTSPSLRISNKVRSRSLRTSTRKSHIKTRDNFEREEAFLPW